MYPTWHDIDMDAYLWSIHVQCQREGDAETAQTKQQEMREKVRISTEL